MRLIPQVSDALGCLYIKCSGFGLLDDASTRSFKASVFLATWLMAAFFSVLCVFNTWILDLSRLYSILGPFKGPNPRIEGIGFLVIVGVPALYVAVRIGRKYNRYTRTKATFTQSVSLAVWYAAVIMSIPANKTNYGCVLVLLLHVAFFIWLLREGSRGPEVTEGRAKG